MTKVNAVLIAVLMTCALLLVTSQHRARKGFIELERAQAMARKHEVEWQQLQLEQTQLAKHSRIDAVARKELRMQPVTPERTLFDPGKIVIQNRYFPNDPGQSREVVCWKSTGHGDTDMIHAIAESPFFFTN